MAPYQGRSECFTTAVMQAIAGVNVMLARKILLGVAGVADTLNADGSLLEVGCGTGFLQLQLAKAFPHARSTGVDIDPAGLATARRAVEDAGLEARVQILERDSRPRTWTADVRRLLHGQTHGIRSTM